MCAKVTVMLACFLIILAASVSAQDFCEGNFDYDLDVDGSDASVFKQDFGRSKLLDPCPPDGPASVAKTGQTMAYGGGDDGDLEKGVAWPNPRFADRGDGTVKDNLTGLIWLEDANCFGEIYNWEEALSDCTGLASGSCGLADGSIAGDWRLPNRRELLSLLHDAYYNPALSNASGTGKWTPDDPFKNVQSYDYWSSTTSVSNPPYAWAVSILSGATDFCNKEIDPAYVWPVRGGK